LRQIPASGGQEPAGEAQTERVPLRRFELLLIFAFWTVIALLSAANALLDPRGRSLQAVLPSAPIALAFIESYLWAILTPPIFWLGSRFQFDREHWVQRAALFIVVGIACAILVDVTIAVLRYDLFYVRPARLAELGPLGRMQRLWFINELLVYVAVLAAGLARDYFLRYRARREEAMRLQAQAAQLQAQLADARLAALRNQLNPHFLFNTLHAISALVERDPRGVRRMIARLSELLRSTLEGANEQEVPLEEEIAFVRRYLEIMQIRFQGKLDVHIRVQPEVLEALVPNLILQPLVENAIKHGVSKIDETGRIDIEAHREGDSVVLCVRDNGPVPAGKNLQTMEGFGLRNTRDRLAQLYGDAQSLVLQPAGETGVAAIARLPYRTRADLHAAGVPARSREAGS